MLKAIIVDDEAPARSELRFLLDETGEVEVAAEATNVREAIFNAIPLTLKRGHRAA